MNPLNLYTSLLFLRFENDTLYLNIKFMEMFLRVYDPKFGILYR